jgi:type II secretory pathway component PulK
MAGSKPGRKMKIMRDNHGIALIIVLWISVILSGVAIAGAYVSRIELRRAYYPAREMQLLNAALSGIEKVKIALLEDKTPYDSLRSSWKSSFAGTAKTGEANVTVTVEDEESKLNINTASEASLDKLTLSNPGLNISDIKDFIRKYRPLDCVEELFLANGFDSNSNLPRLKKMTTVLTANKININTAPAEVLMTLPGIDYLRAQAIIARRNGKDLKQGTEDDVPFETVGSVEKALGPDIFRDIGQLITVKSSYFRVTLSSNYDKYSKTVEAVLFRNDGDIVLKYWREL